MTVIKWIQQSFDYTDKLCVNLDLGMYDDEFSTQGTINKTGHDRQHKLMQTKE